MNESVTECGYKRNLERHEAKHVVGVYNGRDQSFLGGLANLHSEGLMIVGNTSMKEDCLYHLDLNLPQAINGHSLIRVTADCLWVRSDIDSNMHWAGLHIIDISPEALADIEALVVLLESAK